VGVRWLGISNGGRRESALDDYRDCDAHRRPDQDDGSQWDTLLSRLTEGRCSVLKKRTKKPCDFFCARSTREDRSQNIQSFLLLFFKKEVALPSYPGFTKEQPCLLLPAPIRRLYEWNTHFAIAYDLYLATFHTLTLWIPDYE
jgi:hypothetical protein